MASNHVPSGQVPLQTQNIYNDPSYQTLFSAADRYGTPSWDAQLSQQSGLPPAASPQPWHHGSFTQQPFNNHSQPYGAPNPGLRTASPYQYGQFSQQGAVGTYAQSSNVDPNLGLDPNAIRQQQHSPYPMPMRHVTPQGHAGTITPQALQHNASQPQHIRPSASPFQIPKTTAELFAQQRPAPATSFVTPVRVPEYEIPQGRISGGLHVVDQAALAKATNSYALNKFVNLGSESFHLSTNRTALPMYTARLSSKDLKKAGADKKKLRAKISFSRSHSKALKSERRFAGRPAELKREVSDSGSSTESSDYDSDSTDDEEEEILPVPATRPDDDPHEAVRYDVIKATWCPSTSSPSPDKIKSSMREIWEVLSTIQKRWRIDSKAVSDAEDQKKIGELPVLKSRVVSQRDLLQSALKAALEYSHPDVLYHLGQIKPFLYLCYQFLANRFHSKDYDGPLSSVIFEILSRCGTLTSELLEETKVIKALTSMKKHANDKHKAFIQQVIEGAALNSKKAKSSPPPKSELADTKGAKRPATDSGIRLVNEGPTAKKSKPAEPLAIGIKRDPAVSAASRPPTGAAVQKRPGERPTNAPAPIKTRVTQVTNKPSGIFASLTAASKKPVTGAGSIANNRTNPLPKPSGTAATAAKDKKPATTSTTKPAFSFAQTMASLLKPKEQEVAPVKTEKQLPAETIEEKTKRLRKESRRHLRVTFKPEASLVDVRYFSHHPDEETGHADSYVQDAGDIGGEGRMFKQHKELDVDEDDDQEDVEHKPWTLPSQIDFSVVSESERKRNYIPFGGGEVEPSCPERDANVQRENATLMVFYSNTSDIPPTPREPPELLQEHEPTTTVVNFGTPSDSVLTRCPKSSQPVPAMDFSNLENMIKQFATPAANQQLFPAPPTPVQNTYTPPPPIAAPTTDLASLLTALNQANASQPQPAPNPIPAPVLQPGPPQFDIVAFMANMQAQAATGVALPPPPPGPLPPGYPPFPFAFPTAPPPQDAASYQSPMQPQYDPQSNGGVKRQRDDSTSSNANASQTQGKRHKAVGNRPHKVLACKFFQKGTCNKGDNCTYIHDLNM